MYKKITISFFVCIGLLFFSMDSFAAKSGDLIRIQDNAAVYYLGDDQKRYVFPNEYIFFSWYENFDSVKMVYADELASYPIGGNIKMRAASKLIKIKTDPKVYAVEPDGNLRWISTEEIAIALYGSNWSDKVVDIPDSFFVDYKIGADILSDVYPDGSLIQISGSDDVYYVEGGKKRLIVPGAFNLNLFQEKYILNVTGHDKYVRGVVIDGLDSRIGIPNKHKKLESSEQKDGNSEEDKKGTDILLLGNSNSVALAFDNIGNLVEIYTKGKVYKNSELEGGFFVEDVQTNQVVKLVGELNPINQDLFQLLANDEDLSVTADIQLAMMNDGFKFKGALKTLDGRDRALRLSFRLPVKFIEGKWWNDFQDFQVINDESEYINKVSFDSVDSVKISSFPLSSIQHGDIGYTLAHPVNDVKVVRIMHTAKKGFEIQYDLGFSFYTSKENGESPYHASFEFLLYQHDTEYGFRDSLNTYYQMFSNHYDSGFSNESFGSFAFNVRGENAIPIEDRVSYGFSLYELQDVDFKDEAQIVYEKSLLPFLYNNPKEYWRNDKMNNYRVSRYSGSNVNYNNANYLLYRDQSYTNIDSDYNRSRSDLSMAVYNSAMNISDHITRKLYPNFLPVVKLYQPVNSYLLYNVKPDLDIPGLNFGQIIWDFRIQPGLDNEYVKGFLQGNCGVGTTYFIDPFDYRQEHFNHSTYSLTFDPKVKLPANMIGFSYVKYIKEVKDAAEEKSKYVICDFSEGRADWWYSPYVDGFTINRKDLSSEQLPPNGDIEYTKSLRNLRINAYARPIIVKNQAFNIDEIDSGIDYEEYMRKSVFYGVMPGIWNKAWDKRIFHYEALKEKTKKYFPLVKLLQRAGWNPMNYAQTGNVDVFIERFGDADTKNLYFTLFNSSNLNSTFEVVLKKNKLNLIGDEVFYDLVSEDRLDKTVDGNSIILRGVFPAGELKVIQVQRP